MQEQQDYIRDISEIRSMMERTTKFLSLSGWAGIMAGVYAIAAAYAAYALYGFNPADIIDYTYGLPENKGKQMDLIVLAMATMALAIGTAIYFSRKKAIKQNEKSWNATTRRLLFNMFVPLVAGGLLILVLLTNGFIGLVPSLTLIFYGLSLYIASQFTYDNLKILGFVDIILGLISAYFIEYSLLIWVLGFGVGHIVYGIYVHFKYEK